MIRATVNKDHVTCTIIGKGLSILSESVILVDSILGKMVDDDEEMKKVAVDEFCELLNSLNEVKEN